MSFRFTSVSGIVVSVSVAACSGSSGPVAQDFDAGTTTDGTSPTDAGPDTLPAPDASPDDPLAQRCRIACTAPDYEPCKKHDREACVTACVDKIVSLPDDCRSCLLKASRFSGQYCDGCSICTITSGKTSCFPSEEGSPCCSKADESCAFKLPGPTEAACRSVCVK
jgi:hypothetical protein